MIETINNRTVTVFEMTGSDVQTFLNNQVVSELCNDNNSPQLTVICNPKGRIIYTLIIEQHPERTFVVVDASLSDNFLQYIHMRRFRMDVNINKSMSMLSFNTAASNPVLHTDMSFSNPNNHSSNEANNFWLFMFKAGLPWVTEQTKECFIPQHLNLDQTGVIDFDKGCYPGQEIVARLHFLGKVKKRMQYIKYQADQEYEPNSKVHIPEYNDTVEICAPAVFHQNKWHSQAIVKV